MDPIAHRSFESENGPVELRIFAPQPDADDFRCEYEIVRGGKAKRRYAMGVDPMQSLLLAISGARVTLLYPETGKRDRTLAWLGNSDLGLELVGGTEES